MKSFKDQLTPSELKRPYENVSANIEHSTDITFGDKILLNGPIVFKHYVDKEYQITDDISPDNTHNLEISNSNGKTITIVYLKEKPKKFLNCMTSSHKTCANLTLSSFILIVVVLSLFLIVKGKLEDDSGKPYYNNQIQ